MVVSEDFFTTLISIYPGELSLILLRYRNLQIIPGRLKSVRQEVWMFLPVKVRLSQSLASRLIPNLAWKQVTAKRSVDKGKCGP